MGPTIIWVMDPDPTGLKKFFLNSHICKLFNDYCICGAFAIITFLWHFSDVDFFEGPILLFV